MIALVSVRLRRILEERCERGLGLSREAARLFASPRLGRETWSACPASRVRVEAKCDFCSTRTPFHLRTKIAGEDFIFCCVRCLAAFENDEDEPAEPCTDCARASINVRPR